MADPERKNNVITCLVISFFGAIIGALIISGLFVPITLYFMSVLNKLNPNYPPEIVSVVCNALFWMILFIIPAIFIFRYISNTVRRRRERKKNSDFDDFLEEMKGK